MLNRKMLVGILTLATSLSASKASAWGDPNSVYVPELGRKVHLQKNEDSKEFAADYRDLIDVNLKLVLPFDSNKCSEWRQAVKVADPDTQPSFYQHSQMQLQLQAFKIDASAIANAVGADWTDVGSMQVTKVAVQYQWESRALTSMAGANVKAAAVQEIEDKLNSVSSRQTLITTGRVGFTITNTLLACDLIEGNVSLTLNANATQSTGFHTPALMKTSDILEVSQRVQGTSDALKPENSAVLASESLRAINAAGLLGMQMQKQGFGEEIFKNGEFLQLFGKIFANGAVKPVAMTQRDASELVSAMAQLKYSAQDFSIAKKLPLILE